MAVLQKGFVATRARLLVCLMAVALLPAGASAQNAVDLFNPGANSDVTHVALQADGKVLVSGSLTMLGGGGSGTTPRNHIGRLNSDGSLDVGFNPGANNLVFALMVLPDGNILVGGAFTGIGGGCNPTCSSMQRSIARLDSTGAVDPLFTAPGANGSVTAMALQSNGQIVISGSFTGLGCAPTCTAPRGHIARLNADGSVDATFNPGMNGLAQKIIVQPDGGILVSGAFTTIGGGGIGTTPRRNIARLNVDGSVDMSFDPGASGAVSAMYLQPDGKILVGGLFTMLGGGGTGNTPRSGIGRIDGTGAVDMTFDPGADGGIAAFLIQDDGKITVLGSFTKLGGGGTGTTTRNGIAKLFPNGTLDMTVDPGASSGIGSGAGSVGDAVLQPDQKIVVVGSFLSLGGRTGTSGRNRIGRLLADGSPEPAFSPGADATVQTLALQPDGKILLGGLFSKIGGILGTTGRRNIGRLNPDGSVDAAFDPGTNGWVTALAVQPDGAILVGGQFTMIGGGGTGSTPRTNIARLTGAGVVDAAFNPGANGVVHEFVVLPGGKILVAGDFSEIAGGTGPNARPYLARLNPDGSLDGTFSGGIGAGFVRGIAVQDDGKILVGGNFLSLHLVTRYFIGRLNADGSLDNAFNPGANNQITAFAVQPDGNILAVGDFTMIGGGEGSTARTRIARLLSTGVVDPSFNPGMGAASVVNSLALETDGKVIVGATLQDATHTRSGLARLNTDGSLDLAFDVGANSTVNALALLPSGTLLAGGDFFAFGGGGTGTVTQFRVGEVSNTAPATQALTATNDGSTVTWLRGGTSPELARTTFESSTDAVNFTMLGAGSRIAGGWQLTGQTLQVQQSLYIRARGFFGGGNYDGSGSIIETIKNPYLAMQPFTDDPLVPLVTAVKALHVVELRLRIDKLRATYGLPGYGWADPSLGAGAAIRWQHIFDLRTALHDIYVTAGVTPPSYTDPDLGVGMPIKAAHVQEVRTALAAVE